LAEGPLESPSNGKVDILEFSVKRNSKENRGFLRGTGGTGGTVDVWVIRNRVVRVKKVGAKDRMGIGGKGSEKSLLFGRRFSEICGIAKEFGGRARNGCTWTGWMIGS